MLPSLRSQGLTVKFLAPDFTLLPERNVYAVYPDRRYLPIKVNLFIDAINRHLS